MILATVSEIPMHSQIQPTRVSLRRREVENQPPIKHTPRDDDAHTLKSA